MQQNDQLKRTFDTAAELYDRVRPGYPDRLFDDLVASSGIPDGGAILEVGCGTGQATLPMVQRGYRIVALDLGANMVALARHKLAAFANVEVVHSAFEEYAFTPGSFDLVMSATAWHWTDPQLRYQRAAEALRAGGCLAIIGNTHIAAGPDDSFWNEASQAAYRRYNPPTADDDTLPTAEQASSRAGAELVDNPCFQAPLLRAYPWSAPYDTRSYLDLLNTYSGHISLPDNDRAQLYAEIAELIDTRYGGRIVKGYLATLVVARKREQNSTDT